VPKYRILSAPVFFETRTVKSLLLLWKLRTLQLVLSQF